MTQKLTRSKDRQLFNIRTRSVVIRFDFSVTHKGKHQVNEPLILVELIGISRHRLLYTIYSRFS